MNIPFDTLTAAQLLPVCESLQQQVAELLKTNACLTAEVAHLRMQNLNVVRIQAENGEMRREIQTLREAQLTPEALPPQLPQFESIPAEVFAELEARAADPKAKLSPAAERYLNRANGHRG